MDLVDKSESRLERRKEETRKKIIEAAITLFDKQSFDGTTMEQIAAKADVAKKTLYNHFPVKEAILVELVQRSTKETGPATIKMLRQLPDTRTRIIQMLTKLLETASIHQDIFRVYFAYRMHDKFRLNEDQSKRSGVYDFVQEIVRLGQQSSELRKNVSVEALSNHLELVYAVVIFDMARGKDELSLRNSIEENVDIFLNGAGNRRKNRGK